MTTAPTPELMAELANQLALVEHLHDPRQSTGTLTTPYLVEMALRDEGIRPTPALVAHVLELVEAGRDRVDAA